jgi:hypothetical protein
MSESRKMGADMFEMWDRTVKSWVDFYGSYGKAIGGFGSGTAFNMPGMENWSRMYSAFMDMAKGMPMPFQLSKDLNEAFSKGMGNYQKAYDAWMRGMAGIAKEAYDISRKVLAGDKVDAGKFFEAVRSSYAGVNTAILDSLKDTPFEGVKNVEEATEELLSSMPEDQARSREFLEKLLNLNIKAMNASIAAMRQANKSFAQLLETGAVTGDGYEAFRDSYGKIIEETVESLSLSETSRGAKEIADDVAAWAKASMDLATGWSEMTFKLYDGLSKSSAKMANENMLKETKIESPDQLYGFWMGISRDVMATLVDNTAYYENLSRFVRTYTDWIKAGNKLYRDAATPPSVTKDDIEKLRDELQRVKRASEKRSAPKAKPPAEQPAAA